MKLHMNTGSHSNVTTINFPYFLRNMADILIFGEGETLIPLYFRSRKLIMDMRDFRLPPQSK
jgi:hypothetical protein